VPEVSFNNDYLLRCIRDQSLVSGRNLVFLSEIKGK